VKRPIIFKSWCPVQDHIEPLLPELTLSELRLYMALSFRSRGRARTTEFKNRDLMRMAGLTKNTLPSAKQGLIERGLIDATKEGKETYRYEILERLCDSKPTAALDLEVWAVPIPHDVLFPTAAPAATSAPAAPAPVPTVPAPVAPGGSVSVPQTEVTPSPESLRPVVTLGTWANRSPKRPLSPPAQPPPPPATRPIWSPHTGKEGTQSVD
jgi:hypothetical protein